MTFSPLAKQSWYASSVILTMMGNGMSFGFTSCLLVALQAPGSTIKASVETTSWIVASFGFATMLGYVTTSLLMDKLGRRITYGAIILPYLVGTVLIYTAADVASLTCGRLLAGITTGATATLGPIVIGEYCSPQYRGMFINVKTTAWCLGSLIVHVLGHHIQWKTVGLLCAMPFTLSLMVTYTWPESPSWLAQKKRFRESEEAFFHLRGNSADSMREIKEIITAQRATSETKKTFIEKLADLAGKLTKRNFRKPVLVFVFAAILLETGGRHIFPSYAVQIIVMITGDSAHSLYKTLAVDVLLTVSVLCSTYLIKVVRLRTLLFSTGLVSCIVLFLACLYMYLVAKDVIPKGNSAIPISLFAIYFFFVHLGCIPIPLVLWGEIFPIEHRAVGTSVGGYIISFFITITLKVVPIMLQSIDVYGTFAVLGLCMALALLVLWFILPETKNRTLQEIEDFFTLGRFKDRDTCDEENIQMVGRRESVDQAP